jgi:Ca-activated chloride channel family protein
MRSSLHLSPARAFALAALAAASLVIPATAQIRVGTQTVPLYVTVTDGTRRLVPDLLQEDFMTLAIDFVKQAAEEFIIRLMPEDKAKVGAFNDKLEVKPDAGFPFTNNRDQLIRYLSDLDFGYPTRLYDAVEFAIQELKPVDTRKVVLVFTDGDDTASKIGVGDAVERARADEVMVYSIGMENEYLNGNQRVRTSPDRGLRRLSEETGGGFFLLKKRDELGSTFTRIALELHSQYVMGFSPENLDGKVHKLEVRVKRPGMTARARKSYIASSGSTTPAGK